MPERPADHVVDHHRAAHPRQPPRDRATGRRQPRVEAPADPGPRPSATWAIASSANTPKASTSRLSHECRRPIRARKANRGRPRWSRLAARPGQAEPRPIASRTPARRAARDPQAREQVGEERPDGRLRQHEHHDERRVGVLGFVDGGRRPPAGRPRAAGRRRSGSSAACSPGRGPIGRKSPAVGPGRDLVAVDDPDADRLVRAGLDAGRGLAGARAGRRTCRTCGRSPSPRGISGRRTGRRACNTGSRSTGRRGAGRSR